ncbi:MAG: hypothetical protein F6K16_41845 [Symploca sp. SIO2B6]|nr:hypothetical protein [Symploca sp. SIO2B6]
MLDHSTLTVEPSCHTTLSDLEPISKRVASSQVPISQSSIPRWMGHEALWIGSLAIVAWGLMFIPTLMGHPHLSHVFMHGAVMHGIRLSDGAMHGMDMHGVHDAGMGEMHQHGPGQQGMGGNPSFFWMLQLGYFAIAWQVMIVAMMFPTVIPVIRYFAIASHDQPRHRLAVGTVMLAYATVWSGFGFLVFGFNLSLNRVIALFPWLQHHAWIVVGLALLVTGAFQFTSLKALCMEQCQEPLIFVTQHYQRGLKAAWRLGISNGLACVGCCWALMLVMVAAQMCSISWMLGLTGIMLLEKSSRFGRAISPWVGATFIGLGGYVFWFHQLPVLPMGFWG